MTTAQHHSARTTRRHRRILAAAAIAATVAAVTTGCTKKTEAEPSPSSPPATSPSPSTDPQAADKDKVLATYNGFWTESVKAYAAGTEKDTKLVDFASGSALDRTLTDLANMQKAGVAKQGSPGHLPEVTALNLTGERPTATVTDCLDLSTWQTIERSTGKVRPYPSEQPMRYVAIAEVEQWAGQWTVVKMTPNGDRTC